MSRAAIATRLGLSPDSRCGTCSSSRSAAGWVPRSSRTGPCTAAPTAAGEFGHFPIVAGGPRCVCGNRGCLEAVVGERALVERARREGVLAPDEDHPEPLDKADAGSAVAQEIYREAGEVLGRAVAGLINIVDPEAVVLAGEGVGAWQHWNSGFEPALDASLPAFRTRVPVEIGSWDDRTWIQGAAALVLAAPFDTTGVAGEEGNRVRSRVLAKNPGTRS